MDNHTQIKVSKVMEDFLFTLIRYLFKSEVLTMKNRILSLFSIKEDEIKFLSNLVSNELVL